MELKKIDIANAIDTSNVSLTDNELKTLVNKLYSMLNKHIDYVIGDEHDKDMKVDLLNVFRTFEDRAGELNKKAMKLQHEKNKFKKAGKYFAMYNENTLFLSKLRGIINNYIVSLPIK